ncbi:MAG: cation transporter [Burkholderiaceae bacterium]|nr:cation transporter [Burkholderiaceae bacterium]
MPSASPTHRPASPHLLLRISVAVAVVTIVLKMLAWHLTGSVGLLSDAMESFVNLAAAVFALAMVAVAARPADDGHPYGHHKAEYFSSGFEGVLIIGAAGAIVWAAVLRLLDPRPLEQLGWGLALSVASSALNAALAWAMFRSARAWRSVALEADARHLMTDVWTSAGVVLGLLAVGATGWLWLDPVLAIAVGLNILREGVRLVWRAAQGLMDEALEPEVLATVEDVLRQQTDGAASFDHVVSRRAGQRRFLDLHMHLPADWPLGRAAARRADVEAALVRAVPGLRLSIQMLPRGVEPVADVQAAPGVAEVEPGR